MGWKSHSSKQKRWTNLPSEDGSKEQYEHRTKADKADVDNQRRIKRHSKSRLRLLDITHHLFSV